MPQILKKQTSVRQIVTPFEGVIVDAGLHPDNPDDFTIKYLVERTDEDGTVHQRWFKVDEVEEVK